jgi:hypothetical protein
MSAVATLYSVKVGKPTTKFAGATCAFVAVGMTVNNDPSPLIVTISLVDAGYMYKSNKSDAHKLSGVGGAAYWTWGSSPGTDAPQVFALKGKIDCEVSTNETVDLTTLPYTTSGGNPVVTTAAAADFAAKLGAICSDVFKGK